MINTKQLYADIPTVNKPEIERVFNGMMDKLKIPGKRFVSAGSFEAGADYIHTRYRSSAEAFDTLSEIVLQYTCWGIWWGIWQGTSEDIKWGHGCESDQYCLWSDARDQVISYENRSSDISHNIGWDTSSPRLMKDILQIIEFSSWDVAYHIVRHGKASYKLLFLILLYICTKPITWLTMPILLWYVTKAVWQGKKLFKDLFNLYQNGVFTFWIIRDCIVYCVNPKVSRNSQREFHNDKSAAIEWENNDGLWFLNGVKVTQEIVETPAEKLDPKIILTEQNAEVRREIVRKIGMERICYKLNAEVIDRSADGMYELLLLDWDDQKRPYLKMRNPSINTYHVEGVWRKCRTVAEALADRMSRVTDKGIVLSENGQDWYQQGDVIVYPKGAKVLKQTPIILT